MAKKISKGKRKLLVDITNFQNGLVYPGQLIYFYKRLHCVCEPIAYKAYSPNGYPTVRFDFKDITK